MHVLSLVDIPQAVPLGAYSGQTGMQAIISQMNESWRNSGSGVIFGQGVFADRYRAFTELVTDKERAIVAMVEKSVQAITCPDKFMVIDSQEALEYVPECMRMPILTYAPVRKLFDAGMIGGWGFKWEDLPQEDVVGRMLEDGAFHSDDEKWMKDPESGVTYHFRTGDPNYTIEQLQCIQTTREFIDTWLEEQMGPDGDNLDITDLSQRMGKLRDEEEEK